MKVRKITVLFLIAGMLLSGCGKDASDTTDISSIKLKSNQKIVIGKITEIAGNEMTYTILKKASNKNDSSNTSDQSQNSNGSSNTSDQSQNSNGSNNTSDQNKNSSNSGNTSGADGKNSSMGEMQNNNAQGQMPSGQEQAPGNPPDQNGDGMQGQQNASSANNTNNTDNSSKSKGDTASKSRSNSDSKKNMTMYTSTNKSATMTIPVGTAVITSLGNKTTFSRLSNGDVIKMIVETDQDGKKVIVGIWMV